ncbi:MAG TPA: phosphatidylserine decarboxylase [Terriglobales bacterium]|jgi:phosphatidylserine decarboxylase|nr:phosphatidylserine decarboxylase [Terriglobales bacterium]
MVRDGLYYALALVGAAVVLGGLAGPWYAAPPMLLALFFLWFFRDPERAVPAEPGAIVSPADGKVTSISTQELDGWPRTRVSIFLNVFDVHVNRSPIAGVIRGVEYRKGQFRNAMGEVSSELNEQNVVTVEGEDQAVIFKQIAGILARRIVFSKRVGDIVRRGERVGLIKFGSRVDVIFDSAAELNVRLGERVQGGSTVLAHMPVMSVAEPVAAGAQHASGGQS